MHVWVVRHASAVGLRRSGGCVPGGAPGSGVGPARSGRPQAGLKPEMMENCPGLVARNVPRAIPAAFQLAALAGDQVRISYSGHSTFLVESPGGVKIATDYNDYVKPRVLPDVVTMNHAHSTHYTDNPDPGIQHVLRGWGPSPEQPARHDLHVRDVRVRNVPTNIRSFAGRRHRTAREFDLRLRNREPVHRASRPSASHAEPAAAQRDRPHRCGDGSGRRRRHARPRRHGRGAAIA